MQTPTGDDLRRWRERVRDRLVRVRTGNAPADPAVVADRLVQTATADGALAAGNLVVTFADGTGVIGSAWLLDRGETAALADLEVPVERVPAALDLLRAEAADRGWTSMMASAYRGDPVGAAVRETGAELVATKMSQNVQGVPDAEIELRPMTQERFERFRQEGIEDYAHAIFGAGGFAGIEDARRASTQQHEELLPSGLQSPGQLLWSAFDPAARADEVGILWIEERPDHGFIYDIAVDPGHQRKGYGTQMLRAGAAVMRDGGRNALWLNVFGHNSDARRLYEREGYAVNEEILRIAVG